METGEWENDKKPLKPLLSREDEVSVDYKPECPIKDSRGCCLYIQQHHSKSVKGQNGHEENKARPFSPAVIAEGCETFTFFHHYPQKQAIYPSNSQDQLQVRMEVLIFTFNALPRDEGAPSRLMLCKQTY